MDAEDLDMADRWYDQAYDSAPRTVSMTLKRLDRAI
jgi:hypothetical protein